MNSPIESVEILRPMIEGKTFCDLGTGDGEFLLAISKYSKAIGIEHIMVNRNECARKGLNVIFGDHRLIEWPEADFYYSYPYYHDVSGMMFKTAKYGKTLIIGSEPHKFAHFPPELSSQTVLNPLENWRIAIWRNTAK